MARVFHPFAHEVFPVKKAPFVPVKIVNVLLANKGWLRGWREIARNDNLLELIA